jgi:hypothetical protein
MGEIYFSSYKLGQPNGETPTLEDVLPTLESWLFHPSRNLSKPDDYDWLAEKQQHKDGKAEFRTLFYDDGQRVAYGMRYLHPDERNDDKMWITDIVLSQQKNGESGRVLRASISLSTRYTGTALAPDDDAVSRPRLVKRLIDTFGAYEYPGLPLQLKPHTFSSGESDAFLDVLRSSSRVFPVVWISARNEDHAHLVDPMHVADWLAGLAHVVVSVDDRPSREMQDAMGNVLNCYDGAVRIYWSGFSTSDSRYRHRLWLPYKVASIEEKTRYGFKAHLLGYVADATTNRFVQDVVRWSDIERLKARKAIRSLKSEGGASEALKVAETIIDEQDEEIEGLKQRLESEQKESERARNEAESWRLAYEEERKDSTGDETQRRGDEPPATMVEAVAHVLDTYGPETETASIEIPKSVRSKLANEYGDPEAAYEALAWLATTYQKAKSGEISCTDFDHSCREATGFWYRAHQSSSTMGKYKDDYFIQWGGSQRALECHLGKGRSKDPRRTLRIAFFFDESTNRVVVGFIGQHQTTDAT